MLDTSTGNVKLQFDIPNTLYPMGVVAFEDGKAVLADEFRRNVLSMSMSAPFPKMRQTVSSWFITREVPHLLKGLLLSSIRTGTRFFIAMASTQ